MDTVLDTIKMMGIKTGFDGYLCVIYSLITAYFAECITLSSTTYQKEFCL